MVLEYLLTLGMYRMFSRNIICISIILSTYSHICTYYSCCNFEPADDTSCIGSKFEDRTLSCITTQCPESHPISTGCISLATNAINTSYQGTYPGSDPPYTYPIYSNVDNENASNQCSLQYNPIPSITRGNQQCCKPPSYELDCVLVKSRMLWR